LVIDIKNQSFIGNITDSFLILVGIECVVLREIGIGDVTVISPDTTGDRG
jgi:hypothetical protein